MNLNATQSGPGRPISTQQRAFDLLSEAFKEVAKEIHLQLTPQKLKELTLLHYEIEQCRAQKDLVRQTATFMNSGTETNPITMELVASGAQKEMQGPVRDFIVPATKLLARTVFTEIVIPADSQTRSEIREAYCNKLDDQINAAIEKIEVGWAPIEAVLDQLEKVAQRIDQFVRNPRWSENLTRDIKHPILAVKAKIDGIFGIFEPLRALDDDYYRNPLFRAHFLHTALLKDPNRFTTLVTEIESDLKAVSSAIPKSVTPLVSTATVAPAAPPRPPSTPTPVPPAAASAPAPSISAPGPSQKPAPPPDPEAETKAASIVQANSEYFRHLRNAHRISDRNIEILSARPDFNADTALENETELEGVLTKHGLREIAGQIIDGNINLLQVKNGTFQDYLKALDATLAEVKRLSDADMVPLILNPYVLPQAFSSLDTLKVTALRLTTWKPASHATPNQRFATNHRSNDITNEISRMERSGVASGQKVFTFLMNAFWPGKKERFPSALFHSGNVEFKFEAVSIREAATILDTLLRLGLAWRDQGITGVAKFPYKLKPQDELKGATAGLEGAEKETATAIILAMRLIHKQFPKWNR